MVPRDLPVKRVGWGLFFVLFVYFIFLIRQDIIDNIALKKEEREIAKKIEQEEASLARLKDLSSRIKEGDLVEEIARTRLGLIKKGETAYKVILD